MPVFAQAVEFAAGIIGSEEHAAGVLLKQKGGRGNRRTKNLARLGIDAKTLQLRGERDAAFAGRVGDEAKGHTLARNCAMTSAPPGMGRVSL